MVPGDVPAHLRLLLFDPRAFFERHPPRDSLAGAAVVAVVTAALVTLGFGLIGWLFTSRIDATVTETETEPWPDDQCEGFEEVTPEPCTIDEPKTREVDVGNAIWEQFLEFLPVVFLAVLLGWVLTAVGLHVVSALVGGEGGFGGTLAVAGWAMVPQFVDVAAGVVNAWLTLRGVEFAEDPEVLASQLQALAANSQGAVGIAVTVLVTLWQAYVWSHGLRAARGLDGDDAALTAAVVAIASILASLL